MGLIDIIIVALLIAWLGGFAFHLFGTFIHIFLVLALVVFVLRILGVRI